MNILRRLGVTVLALLLTGGGLWLLGSSSLATQLAGYARSPSVDALAAASGGALLLGLAGLCIAWSRSSAVMVGFVLLVISLVAVATYAGDPQLMSPLLRLFHGSVIGMELTPAWFASGPGLLAAMVLLVAGFAGARGAGGSVAALVSALVGLLAFAAAVLALVGGGRFALGLLVQLRADLGGLWMLLLATVVFAVLLLATRASGAVALVCGVLLVGANLLLMGTLAPEIRGVTDDLRVQVPGFWIGALGALLIGVGVGLMLRRASERRAARPDAAAPTLMPSAV